MIKCALVDVVRINQQYPDTDNRNEIAQPNIIKWLLLLHTYHSDLLYIFYLRV